VHWIRSDCTAMERALELALQHAEEADERKYRSRILTDLARTLVIGPRPAEEGLERGRSMLARADGDVAASAFTEAMLAVLEAMNGCFDDARDRWQSARRRLADLGLDVSVAIIQMYYVYIEQLAAAPDGALPEVVEACAIFERVGTRGHLSTAAGLAARLSYALGRYEECEHYCRVSQETAADDDVVSQVLWRGTRAKLLARAGEATRAEKLADGAVAVADGTDFLMMRGDAMNDRAEVLLMVGRGGQAERDLEQAIALYERKGIHAPANAPLRAYRLLAGERSVPVAGQAAGSSDENLNSSGDSS
jgi:tetratricopeptide (TPR) repeat protein